MLDLNPVSLICVAINVFVLYLLFRIFLYNRIKNVMDKRKETLTNQFADAKKAKKRARRLKKKYERSLSSAQQEAVRIVEDAKERADSLYNRKAEEAQANAQEIIRKAQIQIENEREQAKREVQDEITRLAMAAAAKIMGETADSSTDQRLYDQFLKMTGGNNDANGE